MHRKINFGVAEEGCIVFLNRRIQALLSLWSLTAIGIHCRWKRSSLSVYSIDFYYSLLFWLSKSSNFIQYLRWFCIFLANICYLNKIFIMKLSDNKQRIFPQNKVIFFQLGFNFIRNNRLWRTSHYS